MDCKVGWVLLLMLGLTGCGGSDSGGEPVTVPPPIIADTARSASDTIAARSADTTTRTEFLSKTTRLKNDYSTQTISATGSDETSVLLSHNSSGDVVLKLTAFDEEIDFILADASAGIPSELQKQLPNGTTTLFLWTFEDDWNGALTTEGSKYLVTYGASKFDTVTGVNDRAYGVIGLETPLANIPSDVIAVYRGALKMDAYLASAPDDVFQIYGDIAINASFETDTVNGHIDRLIIGDLPQLSEILIDDMSLTGNGYQGTVRYDLTTCTTGGCGTIVSSDLNGKFYGNTAQETAGTLVFEGVSSDGFVYTAAGVFEAEN